MRVQNANTQGVIGWCLDPLDLAVSKLAAGREKDHDFVRVMLQEGLIAKADLITRVDMLPSSTHTKPGRPVDTLKAWIAAVPGRPSQEAIAIARMQAARRLPAQIAQEAKIWLDVEYAARDQAKAAGARFDHEERRWYTTKTEITDQLRQWLPNQKNAPAHENRTGTHEEGAIPPPCVDTPFRN